ncbi:cupin 2 barrel domain-containing protein [Halosimplex carlsbadense 2-9-1]|uniref:Cupin 2 barrel domain-containing protein n=1 Tax=Halosimplex carlsbadense 2-9-1 TaxID=797114 RepID=M0D5X9_9EURY|nr:hypothetical protein [Halosimplex carlsbadense]ELZ30268.1 cupin 2 barrel domain-containing protein [Halosimplex carlsbadense 2-9-1]
MEYRHVAVRETEPALGRSTVQRSLPHAASVVEPDSPQRAHVSESANGRAVALCVGAPAVDDVHPSEVGER